MSAAEMLRAADAIAAAADRLREAEAAFTSEPLCCTRWVGVAATTLANARNTLDQCARWTREESATADVVSISKRAVGNPVG